MEWEYSDMHSTTRIPVTAAVFTAATILLSGCIAYDAARATVDVGSAVIGTGVSVISTTGRLVTSPLRRSEDEDKAK
jgi:hypothetical protein